MKRRIALASAAMALCLAACAPAAPQTGFSLDTLPDIGTFTGEKAERWQDRRTDTFVPSDEYGELLPYLGDKKVYESPYVAPREWEYFGLCTADGTIVLEPVYTYIGDLQGIVEGYWFLDGKKDAPPVLVKRDGSAMLEGVAGVTTFRTFADGRVMAITRVASEDDPDKTVARVTVYGTDLKPQFTLTGGWISDYACVGNLVQYNDKSYLRVYGRDGERLKSGGRQVIDYVGDDRYVVEFGGDFGIVNERMEEVLPAEYDYVARIGDHYFAISDNVAAIFDRDLRLVREVDLPDFGDTYWGAADERGASSYEKRWGRYLKHGDGEGGIAFLMDENGNVLDELPPPETGEDAPLEFLEENGYYQTVYKGKLLVKISMEEF